MKLHELIALLKNASEVSEIDQYRDEITGLIPETKRMFDFNQQNYAHQYDLWEHSLQTVKGLPKDIEDDMVYLAALVHDIGKPDCQSYDERDGKINMLTNVKSLTFRLFTDKENAQNHCNVGNGKIVLDTICGWIEQTDREAAE